MATYLEAVYEAQKLIEQARLAAQRKHGRLQGGMDRWIHHLGEECQESVDEMRALDYYHDQDQYHNHKVALISELAQVVQLSQSMIVMLLLGKEKEGEETWGAHPPNPLSSSRVDSGDQRPKAL